MRAGVAAVLALATAGCGAQAGSLVGASQFLSAGTRPMSSAGYIQHVVLVIQENRSFDDFFAKYPGADGATYGCMWVEKKTTSTGVRRGLKSSECPSGDQVVPLVAGPLLSESLDHDHFAFQKEYHHGLMDGFDNIKREIKPGERVPAGTYAYRYVRPDEIKRYWDIAKEWVLADHMFTTQSSDSFTAHQDFIAGGTPIGDDNVIDFPVPSKWGCTAPTGTVTNLITPQGKYLPLKGPFPCFHYRTLRDLLDAAGVSWLYFTNPTGGAVWNGFDAIKAVRKGPQWGTNIVIPETDIFNDIDDGTLPNVSWVIPDAATSDHPSIPEDEGPEWVASIVNAIGESSYWPSTVVIIVWDEWGGNYDHVPPPQLDGQGLGPRIPMLIVSPYDRETSVSHPGYIAHTQYEDGSILKFIEQNWNLGTLGRSDLRATSIVNALDFTQQPRQFVPLPTKYTESYWKHYKPSTAPIDEY